MPERLTIDGVAVCDPIPHFVIQVGESLDEVLTRLGCRVSVEWVPPPTELERIAARAQEVGAEVSALLSFCRTVEDVPAPEHLPRPYDECVVCDARRIVIEMLEKR